MARFTMDIGQFNGDTSKIESYLYKLNRDLEYMFSHLTPEDNFNEKERLIYVANEERQSSFEIALDHISLEMVSKDNIIAAINLSDEGVKIQGEKIAMEGVVTVNSRFKIGLDGSMEANNGTFQGDITASNIIGSTLTGGTITAGGSDDGKIIVKDASNNIIGQWDKTGISVKKGSIEGTSLELGGSGNTGKITVKNSSGTVIGTWDNTGIDVKAGSLTGTTINGSTINGTEINVGGTGTAGTIKVKDGSGNDIGSWTKNGINVKSGTLSGTTINGATINVGGTGVAGSINVKDSSNNVIGTFTPSGITIKNGTITSGTINGATVNVGGSGVTGAIYVKDSSNNTLGSFTPSGITLNGGTINAGTINGSTVNVGGTGVSGAIYVKDSSNNVLGSLTPSGISISNGTISGSTINLGGSGTAGEMIVRNGSGTEIGHWDKYGIEITNGEINVGQFYTDDTYTSIGPFQITNDVLLDETYYLCNEDQSIGISSDPNHSNNQWIWAGWDGQGGVDHYGFIVDDNGVCWAKDFCSIDAESYDYACGITFNDILLELEGANCSSLEEFIQHVIDDYA